MKIGATFSTDPHNAPRCTDVLSEGPDAAAAAALPSCQLVREHLTLAGGLSGVRKSVDMDNYRNAFEGVVRLREALEAQPEVSLADVARARDGAVHYGASLAFFGKSFRPTSFSTGSTDRRRTQVRTTFSRNPGPRVPLSRCNQLLRYLHIWIYVR